LERKDLLEELIKPVVSGLGYIYWGLELKGQGKQLMLRVFIDSEEGVNIEDCACVSRQISAVLDVADPLKSGYVLEVSSPGWDRPLFNDSQFIAFLGSVVEIKLQTSFDGRRKFKGLLKSIKNNEITIQVDNEEFTFPLELVDKANVVPQY
jgi:ribosome maturation factor RimP